MVLNGVFGGEIGLKLFLPQTYYKNMHFLKFLFPSRIHPLILILSEVVDNKDVLTLTEAGVCLCNYNWQLLIPGTWHIIITQCDTANSNAC